MKSLETVQTRHEEIGKFGRRPERERSVDGSKSDANRWRHNRVSSDKSHHQSDYNNGPTHLCCERTGTGAGGVSR